jgi:outer membrane protein
VSKLLKVTFAVLFLALPTLGWAEGKIAVVDLQEAILQTDVAQKRLEEIRNQDDFKADKAVQPGRNWPANRRIWSMW